MLKAKQRISKNVDITAQFLKKNNFNFFSEGCLGLIHQKIQFKSEKIIGIYKPIGKVRNFSIEKENDWSKKVNYVPIIQAGFANFKDYSPLRQVPVKLGPKNFINDSLMPLARHYQVTWRKMAVSGRIFQFLINVQHM